MIEKLPTKVKVAGVEYGVKKLPFVEINSDRNFRGACCYSTATLEIAEQIWARQKQTFTHELVHAMLFEAGLDEQKDDEGFVDRLANVLCQVLQDNDLGWMRGND